MNDKYPCPCCGYYVFSESLGSYEICPICFWQDDLADMEAMYEAIGPNKVSLFEAQQNYIKFAASEERFIKNVRKHNSEDMRDPSWRPLKKDIDVPIDIRSNSNDPKDIYYWHWKKDADKN